MADATFDIETFKAHVARYDDVRPKYEALARIVHRALARATHDLGIEAIVQSRAKERASFAEKSIRKRSAYPDPVNMMTDLCGARVITDSTNDVEPVCAFIRKHFDIDEAENVAGRLGVSEFGYMSVHFIVSLREGEFEEERRAVVNDMRKQDPDAERHVAALCDRRTPQECAGKPYGPGPKYRVEIQVRSLLQHAWAALSHDRVYKSKFDVPAQLKRKLNRIAAALEEADEDFAQAIDALQSYEEYYGAYMPREQLARELEKMKTVRAFDENNRSLAGKAARIAVALERWNDADEALSGFVSKWESIPLADGQEPMTQGEALDAAVAALEGDPEPADRRRAEQTLEGLRQAGVASMFLDAGIAKCRLGQPESGRASLRRAAALDRKGADALTAWAETYEDEDPETALDFYRRAFEVCPADPRALAGFLCFRAADERSLDFIEPMRPTLESAIQCCRERVAVGIYMPWAYYDIGFFSLLLGRPYDSLNAYARAVELSLTPSPIERALERVRRLRRALKKTGEEELDWFESFLLLAKAVKLDRLGEGVAAAKAREEALKQLPDRGCPAIRGKVVVVAGGCSPEAQDHVAAYGPLLREAFSDFGGTIFSGGTAAGVAAIVGDLPASSRGAILKIACLPKDFPHWHSPHPQYEAYYIPGSRFSAHSPIQMWADILRAGIHPSDVRVLGINGGRIAAFEYRLALMMGARVGVLKESGRAAEEICNDPDWSSHPSLLPLPYDAQTVKVFTSGFSSKGILSDEERRTMAQAAHAKNVEKRKRASVVDDRPENQKWDSLREDLKQSILSRMDFIVERLHAVGLRIVREIPAGTTPLKAFTSEHAEQVEKMAEMEHGRWVVEKLAAGWRLGETKDNVSRTHPCLVPWAILAEEEREKDRHYAREIPAVVGELGYAIVSVG